MTGARDANGAAAQVKSADRWISRMAAITVAGLAGIAGALSYSHMRALAEDHGQAGWHAHAFPLSVDGVEIVASLVLLADRRAGHRSGWLPWTALASGTAGSLAANIATAHPDLVSRIIAGWPALALLLAVKLLSGILEHRATRVRPPRDDESALPQGDGNDTGRPDSPTSGGPPWPGVKDKAGAPSQTALPLSATGDDKQAPPPRAATTPGKDREPIAALLLQAARAAMDELGQEGRSLTRDALAARLRQHGYPIRNDRVTMLLRQLRHEHPGRTAAAGSGGRGPGCWPGSAAHAPAIPNHLKRAS
jgi:hypothetical protein